MGRKPSHDFTTRDLAADLVEWTLARKSLPERDAIVERFNVSRATAQRYRAWLRDRYAGRFS